MQYRRRINYSAQQKELMWERWKHGVYISYTHVCNLTGNIIDQSIYERFF